MLESFSLIHTSKSLKVVSRDDCMLFYYNNPKSQSVRRFRIKFAPTEENAAVECCNKFAGSIARFVQVENVKQQNTGGNFTILLLLFDP